MKKLFIKICKFLGYEILDQNNFSSPTLGKNLNEELSIINEKSIILPLGEVKITKKVSSILIIFRMNTDVEIWDQNKRRLFDSEKNEYTFRTLKSLIRSIELAKDKFTDIDFKIIVTDTNSSKEDISTIKGILSQSKIDSSLNLIDLKSFESKIKAGYSIAKFSNMANFYNSLLIAKNEDADLIYFVEDDYIHSITAHRPTTHRNF